MQFIRDLGRQFDALATVKAGTLLFAPRAPPPAWQQAAAHAHHHAPAMRTASWRRAAREKAHDGAEAQWHDQEAGHRKTVSTGGTNRRRLKRVYPNEPAARAAAQAETTRLGRASATMDLTLPYGDARIMPGA
jgi:phage protein D